MVALILLPNIAYFKKNTMQPQPILIIAYGNLSRGDDALAPLLLDFIEHLPAPLLTHVECLSDFQLQIEHALDLQQRDLVLFIDASVANQKSIEFKPLRALHDNSYTTHAMNPASVMQVYQDVLKTPPPPCFLLTLHGEAFELGAPLSQNAQHSLQTAQVFVQQLLSEAHLKNWQGLCDG